MYGTLAGALAARKIRFDRDSYEANVEGRIERVGGTLRITEIAVHYKLTVPKEMREETDRALRVHTRACPAYQSVKDAIRITWDTQITELE